VNRDLVAGKDPMNDMLSLCGHLPRLRVARGEAILREGVHADRLYVLASGGFEVVRDGIRVVHIREPGAFLGEMAAVLQTAPTADVVATEDSVVHVLEGASAAVTAEPALTYAVARLLARRLAAVTAYLVDIKRQYADSETHLGLMDQVLSNLVAMHPADAGLGSERDDVPDY
jgi:CRP-like cAMP-binding protein